jgi:hypothetical protein
MEPLWKARANGLAKMAGEDRIQFDGVDGATGFKDGLGQGPETRADFDNGIPRLQSRELKGFTHDISVDEEILPEWLSGAVSEFLKEGSRL